MPLLQRKRFLNLNHAGVYAPAPGGGAAVTLNPSDKGANISLSGGNLTATNTTTRHAARSTTSHSSGKYYIELTTTTGGGGFDHSLGIANSTATVTGNPDANTGNHYLGNANIYVGAVSVGTDGTAAAGAVICMAVDFDNSKFWFRMDNGNWNNDVIGNQNPDTNTGGVSISTLTGPFFVIVHAENSGSGNAVNTTNFGATAYTFTKPTNFTVW